jgi:hypothetical protein
VLKKLIVPGLIALVAILTGVVVALSWGGNKEAGTTAAPTPISVHTTTMPSGTTASSTHPVTTPPTPVETTPTEETSTTPAMPPVVGKHTDGYTYLFDTIGFDLGRTWKVVPDKVQPRDRVFVVEASCEDYAGHCRGIAVVNKVNAPQAIRLTDESTAIQLAGNTDPANRCYSDGGLHDNVRYQYPYNDGTTKFGNRDLQHRIHKICGRDKGSDAAKERMHSWEDNDLLVYDTDMANPGIAEDLIDLLGRARWLN